MAIELTSVGLNERLARRGHDVVSEPEITERAAERGDPWNARITLRDGRKVRLWLIDSERRALGMRVVEPAASASFGAASSDERDRSERGPLTDEHRAKLREAWQRRRDREKAEAQP